MLLAAGVGVAAMGSSLMMFTPLCKTVPFWVPMVGAFVPLLWLSFAPPANPNLKLALFFSFCFLEGMAIAPIVAVSAAKGVLFSALFLTFAVFAGFTAAAFLAPQGRLLAFQGPLFALLIGFLGLSFLNMFWPSKFAHSILLYGGLALFSALVAVDTQNMIERARCGMGDHVQDAISLFINMLNIFVRISQILRGD
jgi:FtsH-binding integral membrane protein